MTIPAPSPLPWIVVAESWIYGQDPKRAIGRTDVGDRTTKVEDPKTEQDKLNAEFICRAVNTYPLMGELVQELKKAAEMCRYDKVPKTVDHWDALIAKAKTVMGEK